MLMSLFRDTDRSMADLNSKTVERQNSLLVNEHIVNVTNHDESTSLIEAASSGNSDCVRTLLKSGADVNMLDSRGFTPLIRASHNGHVECVNLLLKEGADVNIAGFEGSTALARASRENHVRCAEKLLESGANVNQPDNYGWTALMWATINDDTGCVRLLLNSGADVNQADQDGTTTLTFAVKYGHYESVNLLMKEGADVNATDSYGNTALMFAAGMGRDLCVQFLLENGANVNQSASDSGETALIAAAYAGQLKCTQVLSEAGADVNLECNDARTCVHNAAMKGHSEILSILVNADEGVAKGKSSTQTSRAGKKRVSILRKALAYVCIDNQNEQPSVLAAIYDNDKSRADVNKRDQDGMTPLMLAAMNGHDATAKILLEKGADVKIHVYGFTAVHFAAKEGYHRCIEVLLSTGFNVNDVLWYRLETPLTLALQSGNMKSLEVLLRCGADVNQWKRGGDSPLIIAIKQGKCKQVERLIEAGADVNQLDHKEIPALSVAIQYHNSLEMISCLLVSGADVNHTNGLGQSPLICAMQLSSATYLRNYCIILIATLLGAGARINTQLILQEDRRLCLEYFHLRANLHKMTTDLLYAAGEEDEIYGNVPDYLPDESEINLMNFCRRSIRKHLLNLDFHTHLFARVPKLGLPPSLEKYVVYGQTLDGDNIS